MNNSHDKESLFRRDHFGGLVQFGACDGGTKSFIFFYPVHLIMTLFITISMETRIMRGVFICIGMILTLDLVTVGNLKRLY